MENDLLVSIHESRHAADFGAKGAGLHWLCKHHLNVPGTLVLTFAGAKKLNGQGADLDAQLAQALSQRIDPQKYYAIRSSANVEDGAQGSFAGQFVTQTNVRGLQAVQASIRTVLASAHAPGLKPYLQKIGRTGRDLEMAVLIQEMVQPVLSGVSFSKNPTTGLDEVVIEAVPGLGESLMQSGVTPDRWIFRWGQFTTRPDGSQDYDGTIRTVAAETRRIARLYGEPVDLEWAYDGRKIYWLQIRPITMLTQVPLYSNRISREVLPGLIKPLISSINIPLVNAAWIRLFDSLLGPTHLRPEDLTRIFHYRAYFNMGTVGSIFEMLGLPRESLEMLLGLQAKNGRPPLSLRTFHHLPRVLRFAAQAWNYDKRVAAELDSFADSARELQKENAGALSEKDLIDRINELFALNTRIAYQNIVIPLLMNLYNALLRLQLRGAGIEYVRFDVTAGLDELKQYDPNVHLDGLKQSFERVAPDLQEILRTLPYEQLARDSRFAEFSGKVNHFIHMFGHLSDSGNDFSRKPWREDPDGVVRMTINHVIGQRGEKQITWDALPLSGAAKALMRPIYRRARKFRLKREQVSSIYTSSYGWFRVLFTALADQLVEKGLLQDQDDIFYLTWHEIQGLIDAPDQAAEIQALVQTRREEIEESRHIALPETIYGNSPPPLSRVREDAPKRIGTPTSPGYYQGPLKIVRSREEFDKVQQGDVLAIPHSDVAWTPLFAKAGAVVAEAGGMLSHSSIVAREYGIPCVVSVVGACDLPENSLVYVDGYQGEVIIASQDGGPQVKERKP